MLVQVSRKRSDGRDVFKATDVVEQGLSEGWFIQRFREEGNICTNLHCFLGNVNANTAGLENGTTKFKTII